MKDSDDDYNEETFKQCQKHYELLRVNLENIDYTDFKHL